MSQKHGPLVRLWGIRAPQLPSETASALDLTPFLSSVLREALAFIGGLPSPSGKAGSSGNESGIRIGTGLWKPKGSKTFHHSAAPVNMYERIVPAEDLRLVAEEHSLVQAGAAAKPRPETWILRRSLHEDAKKTGTADWEEWKRCFKESHAECEMRFTPTVLDTTLKRQWDCSGVEVTVGEGGDTWEDFTLKLEESVHKLPPPLRKRVFPVLQVTASARGRREFAVVQVAVVADSEEEEARSDGALRGAYTSIELFREMQAEASVDWIMGVVSDGRGVLPSWVQKMAIPGQIAKDVDMFLEWIVGERKKGVE